MKLLVKYTDGANGEPIGFPLVTRLLNDTDIIPNGYIEDTRENIQIAYNTLKDAYNQYEQGLLSEDQKKENIQLVFNKAWDYIHTWFDDMGITQINSWDALCTAQILSNTQDSKYIETKKYIDAFNKWKDAIMFEYLVVKKTKISDGLPYNTDYSFIGNPPCKFTDIYFAFNTSAKPLDYVFPNVDAYSPRVASSL